jgi:hypothetical protein
MADVITFQRFWMRRDTAANWTSANPVLAAGEIGVELQTVPDAHKMKIGDGTTAWNSLPYFGEDAGGDPNVIDVETPSNASGTVTLDFDSKSRYIGAITLSANVTTLAFSNLPGSGKYAEYELHIKQDGTGSRTFAIPASHKALGGSDTAIASAANAVTIITASTVDNGTTWRYAMQESA